MIGRVGAEGGLQRQEMRAGLADGAGFQGPVGNAVVRVESRRDHQAGQFIADAPDHVADQPSPVFEAAAVGAGPVFCRQKLRQQVAVTLFDVDEVDADLCGEVRGGDVLIFDPLQVVVGEQRRGRVGRTAARFVDCQRIENGVVHREHRPAIAVAAGVRQLQADDEVPVVEESVAVRLATTGNHLFDCRGGACMQPELPWIRTPLVADGGGLPPDQFRPAAAEADVAAQRQLIGPAVETCRRSPPSVEWRGDCRSALFRSAPVETAPRIVRPARARLPSGPPRRPERPAF